MAQQQTAQQQTAASRSSPTLAQQRGRYDGPSASPPSRGDGSGELTCPNVAESWVEVASQPSSSSLSSIGDEIVTTGLQVGNPYRRRRRLRKSTTMPRQQTAPPAVTVATSSGSSSSPEEFDESDSDEDHPLASSAENVLPLEDSDDGDDATALGAASDRAVFQPQPNAFTHPPRSYSTDAALPAHPHSGFARRTFAGRSVAREERGPGLMCPSMREDNDAALRASLTTLLSCAAAARGRSKTKEEGEAQQSNNGVKPSEQPTNLRIIPESDLMQEEGGRGKASTPPAKQKSTEKCKRPVANSRSSRMLKKKKSSSSSSSSSSVVADEALISPTLLTWVVSAGVVVLVSVVGFGAGYVMGREVGRQEGLAASLSNLNDTASSGREVMRSSGGGLRRVRWGAVGRSIVAAA